MSDATTWSVGLVINDAEARSLSESSAAIYILEASQTYTLRFFNPPAEAADDVESLRFEVIAESGPAARELALGIIYRARRAVGLPDRVIPVAWVSPTTVDEEGTSYLDQAKDLIDEELYGLAIVAAEIHLQSQARALIERAVSQREPRLEKVLLQHRTNTSLHHDQGREMIREFLERDLVALPEWEDYRAHLGRRNAVIHAGKTFQNKEADDSIAAVRAVWLHLAEASLQLEDSD